LGGKDIKYRKINRGGGWGVTGKLLLYSIKPRAKKKRKGGKNAIPWGEPIMGAHRGSCHNGSLKVGGV